MSLLRKVVFYTTVAHLRDLPKDARCEIAFAGRSNAGKSSAINALTGHNRLAYVSKTPGRTQHLNYFSLEDGCYLVDLPGYGYAKAPIAVKQQWEQLIAPYLSQRKPLCGLVLLMDIRHPLTELDWHLIDWFSPTGRPIHILLTKSDKLGRQAQINALKEVCSCLEKESKGGVFSVQLFSSLKKTGIDDAKSVLAEWLKNGLIKPERAAKPIEKVG